MLESVGAGLRYVGSTVNTLSQRLGCHKCAAKKDAKGSVNAKRVLEHPDARIILIENWPCNSKAELLAREQHHIRNMECVNTKMPGRTAEQFRAEYAEQLSEKRKAKRAEWTDEKKEAIAQYEKAYGEQHKEAIKAKRQARGHIITPEEAAYKKEWHEQNKARISATKKERINCPVCNAELSRAGLARHTKTQHPA